jgi:hypothetical protein
MNKRILITISIIACAMILNGCVNSISKTQKVSNEENINIESSVESNGEQDEKESDDGINTDTTEDENNEQVKTGIDYYKIGSEIDSKESLFILNNSLSGDDVIKIWGEPESKSEAIEWGADGLVHQDWYYRSTGIELGLVRNDENEQIVFSINLQSPCTLKTSRGIGIGSTKEEVWKAYEHEINPEENNMDLPDVVVGSVYGGIIFNFENDLVTSIFIGAAAE